MFGLFRKARRRWSLLLPAAAVAAFLPNIAARTSIRNEIARRFVPGWQGDVQVGAATLGWLQPVEFDRMQLRSLEERTVVDVARIETVEPFWRFAFPSGGFGKVRIERPHAALTFPLEQRKGPAPQAPSADVDLEIVGLNVHFNDPAAPGSNSSLQGVDLTLHLRPNDRGDQVVQLDPCTPIQRLTMTPGMGQAGLMYIAPILADLAWARGEFSLSLDECRVNLTEPTNMQLKGRFSIHHVEFGARNPILQEIGRTVQALFPNKPFQRIRLADESVVSFEAADGGIRHRDLAFGLPEVSNKLVLRTRGWVGFDQRLDLVLDVPLDVVADRIAGAADSPGGRVLSIPISGTMKQPKLNFKPNGALHRELFDRMLERMGRDEPAAQQTLEALRPIGKQAMEKGLPKVGRFAKQILQKNLPRSADKQTPPR